MDGKPDCMCDIAIRRRHGGLRRLGVVLLVLLLAACGGGGGSGSAQQEQEQENARQQRETTAERTSHAGNFAGRVVGTDALVALVVDKSRTTPSPTSATVRK